MRLPEIVTCIAVILAGALTAPAVLADPAPFTDATTVPPTDMACKIVFEVQSADTGKVVASGYQVAVDKVVDVDHQASYNIGMGAGGKSTFAGGGLQEVTGQIKAGKVEIDGAGKFFDVELVFANGSGSASALIHRDCTSATSELIYAMPSGDWRWVTKPKP